MMIKQLTQQIAKAHHRKYVPAGACFLILATVLLLTACRKGIDVSNENRLPLEKYSRVVLRSVPDYLKVQYNNAAPPYFLDGYYFLLPGKGSIQLTDTTGKMTLTQEVTILPGADVLDYISISDTSGLFIKNTQTEELKPDPGYIKLKFINLAKNTLGDQAFDIVITQYETILRELPEDPWFIEDTIIKNRDTLPGITSNLLDTEYKLFRPVFKPGAGPYLSYLTFLKSSDKSPISASGPYGAPLDISDALSSFSDRDNTVFTYIFSNVKDDWSGESYTTLRLLFEDPGK